MGKLILSLALIFGANSVLAENLPFSDFKGRIFELTEDITISAGAAYAIEPIMNCKVSAANRSCIHESQTPAIGAVCSEFTFPAGTQFVVHKTPVLNSQREGFFTFKATTSVALKSLTHKANEISDIVISCETKHASNDDALLDGMRPRIVMRFLDGLFKEQKSPLNPW